MGEICHRGPGNMTGYWNMPDETAELLRDGWVHSGDVGTWDEDGYIYIVDRKKSMIICGGEKFRSPSGSAARPVTALPFAGFRSLFTTKPGI